MTEDPEKDPPVPGAELLQINTSCLTLHSGCQAQSGPRVSKIQQADPYKIGKRGLIYQNKYLQTWVCIAPGLQEKVPDIMRSHWHDEIYGACIHGGMYVVNMWVFHGHGHFMCVWCITVHGMNTYILVFI